MPSYFSLASSPFFLGVFPKKTYLIFPAIFPMQDMCLYFLCWTAMDSLRRAAIDIRILSGDLRMEFRFIFIESSYFGMFNVLNYNTQFKN